MSSQIIAKLMSETSFAAALRQAREAQGLSQSRLAARAGYDHSYVSRLESDSRSPTRDAVISLSNAMGLDDFRRDRLLAAAGFLPVRVENLLASEPVVSEAYVVLNDVTLPRDVREDLRSAIRMALRQAQRAVGGWDNGSGISSIASAD
jgi:transcriptional regulator with XRE-family HTH domain